MQSAMFSNKWQKKKTMKTNNEEQDKEKNVGIFEELQSS